MGSNENLTSESIAWSLAYLVCQVVNVRVCEGGRQAGREREREREGEKERESERERGSDAVKKKWRQIRKQYDVVYQTSTF
jgi:hypothetical protein